MPKTVAIADRQVGPGCPTFLIAEIGINHNGSLDIAKKLIDIAKDAGFDSVKFQKRNPELCVPPAWRDRFRETPWGFISYLEYRKRVELGYEEYQEIDRHARERDITWFASPWDLASVDFLERFSPACYKLASASLTDDALVRHVNSLGRPVILSTGMSTLEEIRHAVSLIDEDRLLIAHCTSSYPCSLDELNLSVIPALKEEFGRPVGYSGHEVGLATTIAAVALGADFIERHVTLDRAMWGSDQSASVEPSGMRRLVRDVRSVERATGDGIKRVYPSELPLMERLRRFESTS